MVTHPGRLCKAPEGKTPAHARNMGGRVFAGAVPLQAPAPRVQARAGAGKGTKKPLSAQALRDFAKKRGPHGSPAQRVPWGEGGARERSDTWPKGRGERCGLCQKKGTPREPSAAGPVGRRRGKGAERHLAERPGGAVRTLPRRRHMSLTV